MPPTVSVIIPTYNRCAYSQEAIDSVLAQTYTDYEIIVVDDGSTDDTGEVLRQRYGDRIRYAWQENGGQALARNHGVALARGELLAFLDSDDRYLPTYLAEQVKALQSHPEYGVVACGTYLIDAAGQPRGAMKLWEEMPTLDIEACVIKWPFMPSVMLMHRRLYDEVGGQDPSLVPAEDWEFVLRLLLAQVPLMWNRTCLSEYRIHDKGEQGNVVKSAIGHTNMLERVLDDARTPVTVLSRASELRVMFALRAMRQCFSVGANDAASDFLARAIAVSPSLRDRDSGRILQELLKEMGHSRVVAPYAMFRQASQVAAGQVSFRRGELCRTTAGAAQLSVYRAWARGDYAQVLRHFAPALGDPRWLLRIGTWSILLRSLWRELAARRLSCGTGQARKLQ